MTSIPQVEQSAPTFKGQDSKGKLISPDDLMGHPYVLYFYPKDDTPGCTQQACDLRDTKTEFDQLETIVIGISPDPHASHDKFIAKYALNFILLSDPYYEICALFGVWEEKNVFGQKKWGVTRTTFVVDSKGIIRWIEKPVKIEGHAQRVLQAVKNLPKASASL